MPEIGASGTVRGRGGNIPTYSELNHNALPLSVSTHIRVIRDGEETEVAIAELRQLLAVDALIRLH